MHFRRQQAISGFIVDFYCDTYGFIIELDGAVHDSTGEYDQARDKILTDQGFTILRFSNEQVFHHLDTVLDQIARKGST